MLFSLTTTALFLVAATVVGSTLGAEHKIYNASGLVKFANAVNGGTDYAGTTVTLEADIDFTGESYNFYPIGSGADKSFAGTFDGQGHVIGNLSVGLYSHEYVGLFGYSEGATIRNVVMDATVHIDNYNTAGGSVFMAAAIICRCNAAKRPCIIENNVNMGAVLFSGNTMATTNAYIGGIVGQLTAPAGGSHAARVANCANYGPVSHTGTIGGIAYIGGIVGSANGGSETATVSVLNSANYGPLTNAGVVGEGNEHKERIGGVAGEAKYAAFENCLAAGPINNSAQSECAGCVAGDVPAGAAVAVTHCFWTAGAACAKTVGTGEATVTESGAKELTAETMATLGEFAETAGAAGWVMFKVNGGMIGSGAGEGEDGTIIATPKMLLSPTKEGSKFLYWCTDEACGERFDPSVDNMTVLYAKYEAVNYALKLDLGNGTVLERTLNFGDEIPYPQDLDKKEHFLAGWNPDFAKMPAANTEIKAVWLKVERYVVLNLGASAVKKEEYEKTIAKYATAGAYEVVGFDTDESGVKKAVVMFADVEEAEKFAKSIQKSADAKDIEGFEFLSEYDSFGFPLQPFEFILSLLF